MKKLKILITGNTAMAIGSTRRQNVYLSNLNLAVEGLRRCGHDVDQRAVTVGESLDEYDRVIVYLIPLVNFVTAYTYSALWALHRRPDAVIGVSDLDVVNLNSSFKLMASTEEQMWRRIDGTSQFKAITSDFRQLSAGRKKKAYRQGIREVLTGSRETIQWPIVAPVFTWGDVEKLSVRCIDKRWWDPTRLVDIKSIRKKLQPGHMRRRKKRWVFGGLLGVPKMFKKLGLAESNDEEDRWPVLSYGPGTKNGFIDEDELLNEYANSWGVTGRSYTASGSGWWRIRWVQSYALKNVLAMDERDAFMLDEEGELEWTPERIEQLSRSDLAELADAWTKMFRSKMLSTDDTLQMIHEVFTTRG